MSAKIRVKSSNLLNGGAQRPRRELAEDRVFWRKGEVQEVYEMLGVGMRLQQLDFPRTFYGVRGRQSIPAAAPEKQRALGPRVAYCIRTRKYPNSAGNCALAVWSPDKGLPDRRWRRAVCAFGQRRSRSDNDRGHNTFHSSCICVSLLSICTLPLGGGEHTYYQEGGGKYRRSTVSPAWLGQEQAGRSVKTSWVIRSDSSDKTLKPRRPGPVQSRSTQQSLRARMLE
ncbi:hypothetical protein DFH09DRAFT_1068537 [Mycena vulgaris]|nr:hypothetical protein DFH09DRAFT_1068537 [Mycena vulgaris]